MQGLHTFLNFDDKGSFQYRWGLFYQKVRHSHFYFPSRHCVALKLLKETWTYVSLRSAATASGTS